MNNAPSNAQNKVWSTYVQRADMLYKTRAARFNDMNRRAFMDALGLPDSIKLLEIGCGPGALCHALRRWYPNTDITGVDRDAQFVEYAKKASAERSIMCRFVEGDALNLPFEDNTFAATISHTVQEHVETDAFFGEQYRVLAQEGVCVVLSSRARSSINIGGSTPDAEETAFQDRLSAYYAQADRLHPVCQYPLTEVELPQAMEKAGFVHISTHYIAVQLTPDSADVDASLALDIVEAGRQVALDYANMSTDVAPGVLTPAELDAWRALINKRFNKRIKQYRRGEKLWDTSVSILMALRGEKR